MLNENIHITEQEIEFAQISCQRIEEEELRSRAVANLLACKLSEKYFTDKEIDNKTSICQAPIIQELLDISDIYVNNSYIDVRFYFDEQEMFIPASHKELGIEPIAYMFIKLNEDISGGVISGFIPSQSIDYANLVDGYYVVSESGLMSFYDVEPLLNGSAEEVVEEDFTRDIFDFIDGKLVDKSSFLRTLLSSLEARERFLDVVRAQNVINLLNLEESKDVSDEISEIADEAGINKDDDLEINNSSDFTQDEFNELEEFSVGEFELLDQDNTKLTLSDESSMEDSEDLLLGSAEDDLIIGDFSDDLLSDLENIDIDSTDELSVDLNVQEEVAFADSDSLDDISVELTNEVVEQFENSFSTETTPSMHDIEDETFAEISMISLEDSGYESVEAPEQEEVDEDIEFTILSEENPIKEEYVEEDSEDGEISENNIEAVEVPISQQSDMESTEQDNVDDNDDIIQNFLIEEDEQANELQESTSNPVEHIDELFNKPPYDESDEEVLLTESPENYEYEPEGEVVQQKQKSLLPLIGAMVLVCSAIYFGFTKFVEQNSTPLPKVSKNVALETNNKSGEKPTLSEESDIEEAMPIETVENKQVLPTEEPISVSIPAIEKNLDASILVSNLSVGWQVPQSYIKHSSGKKYFTKLGKIIQLNLKTEMLLLNKPPISNKITVELKYNTIRSGFDVDKIVQSSGEKVIDSLIIQTLKSILSTYKPEFLIEESFGKPILIINL